jgi:CRISPR-associated endonuclease/helicase Cas3
MIDVDAVAYAHSKSGADKNDWHSLRDHLEAVAGKAEALAGKWGAAAWGHYAGLWHDLGKFSAAFQAMITADSEAERGKVNHSSAGALKAMSELGDLGLPLAFTIAGHHAGLPDAADLVRRLAETEQHHLDAANAGGATADWLQMRGPLALPPNVSEDDACGVELWIRFLFSALIDADRLDTESFHDREKTASRGNKGDLGMLLRDVDRAIDELSARSAVNGANAVNSVRASVVRDCRERATDPQGVFSLTVPTGGGKTLASVAFALRHAVAHSLDRVIVVIPYTSIIEQNARVLKDIVGEANVLEHHTNFDPGDQRKYWLDAENWDAPIVVTTSVQFFESLFANRPSAVRKIHAIARSVVIFDEVQTMPPSLLHPIVDVMRELAERYQTSIVLSTATQPALQQRPSFPIGLRDVHEIVSNPRTHFTALTRVEAIWPEDLDAPTTWADLAPRIAAHERVLTIVHRRDDAQTLCNLLPGDTIHLSAAMCPAHRSRVLDEIRDRLKSGQSCRVVATQLVEAGVDVDFPVVFRALGGLDALAQAAGRCNREGRLPGRGTLAIFVAESAPPRGPLTVALSAARITARQRGGKPDLFDPTLYEQYFLQFYRTPSDEKGVQTFRKALQYASTAEAFQMIDQGEESIVVPLDGEARAIIRRFERSEGSPRLLRRQLQRYSVAIPKSRMNAMRNAGAIRELGEGSGVFVLDDLFRATYDQRFGLLPDADLRIDPTNLIR